MATSAERLEAIRKALAHPMFYDGDIGADIRWLLDDNEMLRNHIKHQQADYESLTKTLDEADRAVARLNRAPDPMITVEDLDNLRHMLGVTERHPRGYRNYFVAGTTDVPSMQRLVAAGFAVKNDGYKLSSDPCYHATLDGARAVGLKALPR